MENSACFTCRNSANLVCHCKIAPVLYCYHCFQIHSSSSPQILHLTSSIDSAFFAKRIPSGEICICGSSSESCMFCRYSLENKKRRLFDSKEYYNKDLFTISDQILQEMNKNSAKIIQFKNELQGVADRIVKATQSWVSSCLSKVAEIEFKIEEIVKGIQLLKLTNVYDESNYIHWYIKDLINSPESLQNIAFDLFDFKFRDAGFEEYFSNLCEVSVKRLVSPSLCYFHPGTNKCTLLNLSSKTNSMTQINTFKTFYRGASWCKVYDQKYFYCGGEDKTISDKASLINPFEGSHIDLPSMFYTRSYHSVIYYNQSIYVFGGHSTTGRINSCEKYVFERNEWIKLPKMIQARSHFTATLLKENIFIAGGCGSNIIEKFSPSESLFTKLMISLPHQSYWTMTCSNHDNILVFQGTSLLSFPPEAIKGSLSKIVNNGGWWSEITPVKYNSSFYFFRKNLFLSFNPDTNEFTEESTISNLTKLKP